MVYSLRPLSGGTGFAEAGTEAKFEAESKKNVFFMKSDWTVRVVLVILMGSLPCRISAGEDAVSPKAEIAKSGKDDTKKSSGVETSDERIRRLKAELQMTCEELSFLRKELERVAANAKALDDEVVRLRVSMAASLADGSKRAFDKEGVRLIETLLGLSNAGGKLVSTATDFCTFMGGVLEKEHLSDIDKARAKLRLDAMRAALREFHARISKPPKSAGRFKGCRIIAVDDKSQAVALDAGAASGVRCGLLLWVGEKNEIRLKVVETRPFMCAAIVVEGKMADLAPGMVPTIGKKQSK